MAIPRNTNPRTQSTTKVPMAAKKKTAPTSCKKQPAGLVTYMTSPLIDLYLESLPINGFLASLGSLIIFGFLIFRGSLT